jgi:hypothetical protein
MLKKKLPRTFTFTRTDFRPRSKKFRKMNLIRQKIIRSFERNSKIAGKRNLSRVKERQRLSMLEKQAKASRI